LLHEKWLLFFFYFFFGLLARYFVYKIYLCCFIFYIDIGVSSFVEHFFSNEWIYQLKIQSHLEVVCRKLKIQQPLYSEEEPLYSEEKIGIHYFRYKAFMCPNRITKDPFSWYGRLARNAGEAREDVAVMVLRRLLCTTGRTLRDFNYYNIKILEQKILVIEAEKSVFEYENQKLKEQLDVTMLHEIVVLSVFFLLLS
jgi:hypothetical protein